MIYINYKKIFLSALLIIFVFTPMLSLGAVFPLVQCGTTSGADGVVLNACDFNDIIETLGRVISFLLFYLAVPIAAIMFAYAGFLLLFAGGNSGQMQRAKGIFTDVAVGLALALAAWLIITTILNSFGYSGWNPFQ